MSPRPPSAPRPRGPSGSLSCGSSGETVGSWLPGRGRGAAGDAACECGHAREAHEHYRRGSDCALCSCPRYRRA